MDKVYLVYKPHTPAIVELSEGQPTVIMCQNDICMIVIDPSLVGVALSKKCGCCGSETTCFRLATDEEIRKFNGE